MYYVLRPVLRPDTGLDDAEGTAGEAGADPDDDLSPRAVALRALKEIEFDRETGKLSETDYALLKLQYTGEALAALRADATRIGSREPGDAPATSPSPASRLPSPACPTHGPRPEPDAQFCGECGRRLGTAAGYCARCGTALEQEARYCHSCGTRVAA